MKTEQRTKTRVSRTRYVKREAVRKLVHRTAQRLYRDAQIHHVAAEVYDALDALVERAVKAMVQRHPSAYKTLRP